MSRTFTIMTDTTANVNEIPNLSLEILTKPADKHDALKLIADSVAQQQQIASKILIFHPYCLAGLSATLAVIHCITVAGGRGDVGTLITMYGGVFLAYLITIRYFTVPYIHLAEETDWQQWLNGPDGVEDVVFGTRFGNKVIGTLVVQIAKLGSDKRGSIRAWTVQNRYRGKGLGGDMLLGAVALTRQTTGRNACVGFAGDHANSTVILHSMLRSRYLVRDGKAKQMLSRAHGLWERQQLDGTYPHS